MGNHTATTGGGAGAYTARAQMRASGRNTAATSAPASTEPLQHPQAVPIVHAPPTAFPAAARPRPASRPASRAGRAPVASSAALAFHRAHRPAGSTLRTIGPGLYLLKMPGMAARTITGAELNQAFREASRVNRQGARAAARAVHEQLHPRSAGHASTSAHGHLAHEALHLYHGMLHSLGRVMGH